MVELRVGDVTVNVSVGCGGIWFANFKLKKAEASDPSQRSKLIELSQQYHLKDVAHEARLRCPVDADVTLMRRFFSFKKEIEIDECPMCGGIWLDPDEFEKILELYHSPEALEAAKKREQAQQAATQIREDMKKMRDKEEKERAELARQYDSDTMLFGMFMGLF